MTRAKNLTSTEGTGIENAENAQIENNEYTQIEISCSNPGKKKIYNASPWKKRKSRFTRKENNKCRKKRKMLDDIQTENTENIQMENTENIQIEYRYSDPGKTKIQHGKTRESLDLPKKKKKKLCRKTRNLLERFQIKNTENIQIENTEENLQIENTENLPKENTENLQIENTENLQIENTENLQIENTEKNLQKEKNITWKTWRKKQLGIILRKEKKKYRKKRKLSDDMILEEKECTETFVRCRLCQDETETFFFKNSHWQNFYRHMDWIHKEKFELS
ncbi:unnamed protein product [Mytilus coruscus]|uniref:Uncharacterized protein n=1 Tax=Mytilus coruscus TaxID=42192 RepID=A0A6J8BZS2_MYTCO|nr:unnamed protein product [Mytilus coruscus]